MWNTSPAHDAKLIAGPSFICPETGPQEIKVRMVKFYESEFECDNNEPESQIDSRRGLSLKYWNHNS